MKIHGIEFKGPNEEIIPIIRNGKDFILKAKAVLDFSEFEKLCPEPQPPTLMRPGGKQEPDLQDKKYIEALAKYQELRAAYMYLKSLESTEGLEWETVDMSKPDTWKNYENELKAGFTDAERIRIMNGIMIAQGFDSDKVEEARQRFLVGQGQESSD